jgi:transcriptional regulator with XRE-family HTH domain
MQNGRGKSKYSSWTPEDLTNFRKEAGLSRREVADSLGVSYRMYCYYESGHTKIDLPLEYAVRWLANSEEDKPVVESKGQGTLTPFQRERIQRLLNGIRSYPIGDLDERGQKILSQCVDEISVLTGALE